MKIPDRFVKFLDRGGDSLFAIALPLSLLLVPSRMFAYVGKGMPYILCLIAILLSSLAIIMIRKSWRYSRTFAKAMDLMEREKKLMREARMASVMHAREMLHWMKGVGAGPEEIAAYKKLLANLEDTLDE